MSLGEPLLALVLAGASFVGAVLAGALLIVAMVACVLAIWLALFLSPFAINSWLCGRRYRRHRKWVDGLCQGEPPK